MSVAQPLDSQGRSRGIAHETVIPHTNITDTGVPHDSLTDHIDQLTRERNALARQLTSALNDRRVFAERLQIAKSTAT